MITITEDEYKSLQQAQKMLWALERAGVDNREGYEWALEQLEQND